jgi:putative peptidoglycan lipid II flippase
MKKDNRFLVQATRLGGLTLASSLLGFVREILIAREFGATHLTDSYLVALSVPMLIYALFFGSGLNVSLVPRLANLLSDNPSGGRRVFAQFLSGAAVWSVLATCLILLFPGIFVRIFAPGIASSPITVGFVRSLAPLLFLFVISFALGSFHCARDRASQWGLITLVQNATFVLFLLLLGRLWGIKVLLIGTIGGALLSFLVQARATWADGFRESWVNPFLPGEGNRILASMVPFALVLGVGGDFGTAQADIFLIRFFASRLAPGSITLLALGNKLMALPVLLIGAALGLALLPSLSISVSKQDQAEANGKFARAISYGFLLICPIALIYLDLGVPIAHMVFGRTALRPAQLDELGGILSAYAGAALGLVVSYILNSYLAALRRTQALIGAATLTVVVDALLMWILCGPYLTRGIAMAISAGSFFYCTLLAVSLAGDLDRALRVTLLQRAGVILVGAIAMHLALVSTLRLNVFTSLPWFGSALFPALAGLTLYVIWLMLHRTRLQLGPASL